MGAPNGDSSGVQGRWSIWSRRYAGPTFRFHPCQAGVPKRLAACSFAFRDSSSRFRGEDFVSMESMSRRALAVISSTARLKASSFAREGCVVPLSFRTYCSAESRTSCSVAGGSK